MLSPAPVRHRLRDLSHRTFAELRLEQGSFVAFVGTHADALADLLPTGKPVAPPSGLPSAAALVGEEDAPAAKCEYTADDASRAVLAAPPLQCLATATMWADVFEPSVGGLAAFLQSRPELLVLEVQGGSVVRLPRGGVEEFKQAERCIVHAVVHAVVHAAVHDIEEFFKQAAARLDAVSAAALSVSLCVDAGSAALAPLALLGGFVQRALAGAGAEVACAFVLSALSALPAELRAAVGGSVFLEPARAVLPDACRALLGLADAAQRRMLHRLGGRLGQTELTSELAATLFEPPLPLPAVKHAGGAPSTFLVSAPAAPWLLPMSSGGLPEAESEPTNETPEETQPTQPTAAHVDSHGPTGHGAASSEICARVAAKYGVGLDSSAESVEVRRSLGNLQHGLMRSIHRLAAELYSGNVHFVLELVQNADDNAYTPGVVPTLRIVARREQIVFENNETGFAERHVLAICSMGESTKQASDAGYIGNKGIGFKSVFKLTTTPEVHSRDYHIRFDSSDGGGLGYIVPKPIAEPAGWDASLGTAIVLPLAASGAEAILREFRVHLHEIKPTLLLFLHRLHRLVACDELGGVVRTMERRAEEEDAAVTVLTETTETTEATGGAAPPSTTSTQRWLVIKRSLDVSQLERDGISHTEITLAFPLRDPSHGHGAEAERVAPPPALDVFAYLPLRSYGLRFLLQADWMVPSSREAVDASSPWNQFIRDRVPALLRQAADEFVARASALLEAGDAVGAAHLMSLFLEALPVAGQVVEFFAPLAGAAAAALRGCSCVLTADGQFVLPCEALLNELQQDATASGQTTQALVQELSLSHAHPQLRLPPAVAAALGVRRLDAALLCELLGALSQRWHAAADVDLEYVTWAFELLQRDAQCGASLPVIRRLRLLPLADGSLGSTEQGPVYELASALRPLAPRLEGLSSLGPARRGLHPRLAELAATRRDGASCWRGCACRGSSQLRCSPSTSSPRWPRRRLPTASCRGCCGWRARAAAASPKACWSASWSRRARGYSPAMPKRRAWARSCS